VDVVATEPEPVRFDPPALAFEPARDRELTGQPAAMPRVAPFGDGTDDVRRRHGANNGERGAKRLTDRARAGAGNREGVAQRALEDLARRPLGKAVDERDRSRILVRSEPLAA